MPCTFFITDGIEKEIAWRGDCELWNYQETIDIPAEMTSVNFEQAAVVVRVPRFKVKIWKMFLADEKPTEVAFREG